MNYKELDISLQFMDAAYYDEQLWFVDNKIRKLSSISIKSGVFQTYFSIDYEDDVCRKVFLANNKMYFISKNGNVTICNLLKGIAFQKRIVYHNCDMYAVKEAFVIGETIWFVPTITTLPIVVFDMDAEEFLERKVFKDNDKIIAAKHNGSSLFFTFESGRALYEYKLLDDELIEWKLGIDCEVAGFDCGESNFWFKSRNGLILYKWSKGIGLIEKYSNESLTDDYQDYNAKVLLVNEDDILVLPVLTDDIFYLNQEKGKLCKIQGMDDIVHKEELKACTFSIGNICLDNQMILFPWGQDKLVSINLKTMRAEKREIIVLEESYYYLLWEMDRGRVLIEDNELNSLKTRISMLSGLSESKCHVKENNEIGKKIFKEV